jgi:hypothetical protein
MNKILDSTKELLGIPAEVKEFDSQLVIYVNMQLSTLDQIGLGTEVKYQTTVDNGDLEDFLPNDDGVHDQVKMYIYLKTRILFDPPTTTAVLEALQRSADELEWRLKDYAESPTPPSNP